MDFLDVLKKNNEEEIKKYLVQYGKCPKPRAPFYFIDKEELDNVRNTVDERTNETDSRNYGKTEIAEQR